MSTVRRPIPSIALRPEQAQAPLRRPGTARSGHAGTRHSSAPSSQPLTPPQVALLQRRRAQHLSVTLIIGAAAFCVAIGVLYLSGYAGLQYELNRRVRLKSQLRAAQEKSKQYQQRMAQVNGTQYIETQAQKMHMPLADERQAMILEENR